MSKTISNTNSLQSSNKSSVIYLLTFNFLGNCWSIFSCITFTKDKEWMVSSNSKFVEASLWSLIKLNQCIPKIIGHIRHIFTVDIWEAGVGIAQACSNWLINKQDIIILDPGVIILDNFIRSHYGWLYKVGTKLHEIAQLTGRSWSSIKPDNCRVILQICFS